MDVSTTRHRTRECTKERVQNLRSTKEGPNHPKKRDKRVVHKAEQLKGQTANCGVSSRPRQTRSRRHPRIQPQYNVETRTTPTQTQTRQKQHHRTTATRCPHVLQVQTQQTALKRRNQIWSNIKKYEAVSFQEGFHGSQPQGGSCGKAQNGTGASTARFTTAVAEKHLRSKRQGSGGAQTGAEHQHGKDSESDGHEAEARERNQRYQEAAGGSGGGTRPCVQRDEPRAIQRHEPRDCRPEDHKRSHERGSNQANCRHLHYRNHYFRNSVRGSSPVRGPDGREADPAPLNRGKSGINAKSTANRPKKDETMEIFGARQARDNGNRARGSRVAMTTTDKRSK